MNNRIAYNQITLMIFLFCNQLISQNIKYYPLSSEGLNFTIDNFQLDSTTPNPHYLILKDSVIFTYNNDDKKIYYSSNYGVNFNDIKFSSIFKSDDKQIVGLYRRNDDVFITFNDGKQNLIKLYNNNIFSNEINFEQKPFNSNASYFNFMNKILIKLFNKIYVENEKKWIEYEIPTQNNIVYLYEYKDYIYVFHVDNKNGVAENNGILKSKDLISWENVEIGMDMKVKLFQKGFKINALTDNYICFRDNIKLNNFYDLRNKTHININGISNINYSNRIMNIFIPYQTKEDKVFVFVPNRGKLSSINFETLSLKDEFEARGSSNFNFYYSNKFGIFSTNEICFFDEKIVLNKLNSRNIQNQISNNVNINNPQKQKRQDLKNIPIDQLTKEQCFELMDEMVKSCNGKNMTDKNYTQFQASFTADGYAVLTDYKILDERDLSLIVCRNIKWETLYSVSTNELNFQYSCVCLKFPKGFYCYRQIARTTDSDFGAKILNNKNPITLNENDFAYKMIQNPYSNGDNFTINLKKQDVNKFVELVKRVSIIEREKYKNMKQNLISKEKWNGSILIKWHEDLDGNRQGRYEEYDIKGNLVTYGNYRNNVREMKWVINGVVKDFPIFSKESCFCN